MILEIFKYSLEYAVKDKIAFIKLSLLTIFSFLIIPFIMIEGYYYRIIAIQLASFINANDPLPSYKNIKKLLEAGIKVIFVSFVYSLPFFIAIFFEFDNIVTIREYGVYINIATAATPIAIIILIGFLTFLVSKVAIVNMVYKKSLYSAFKLGELKTLINEIKVFNYFKFFIMHILLLIAILFGLFFTVEFIGSVLGLNLIPVNLYFFTLGLDLTILFLVYILIVYPLIKIFEARAIASIFNIRE